MIPLIAMALSATVIVMTILGLVLALTNDRMRFK